MNNFDQKLNKGAEELKKIVMTPEEKKQMLLNILNSPVSPYTPTRSPFHSFTVFIQRKRIIQYVLVPCLVVVLAGGGVGFAANGSLPGNTFYSVKVKIVEPLGSYFKFSNESRAEYASALVNERLMEAEALALKDKLDDSKEEELSKLLENHTNALNNYRGQFQEDEIASKKDNDIVSDFEGKVTKHVEAIDKIRNTRNSEKVEEKQETKIIKTAKASIAKVKEAKANKVQNTIQTP